MVNMARYTRTLLLLLLLRAAAAAADDDDIVEVFTADEVAQCGNIRIPQITVTPHGVLLLGQCRKANASLSSQRHHDHPLFDDQSQAKVVSKFSPDFGKTWTAPMRVLTPRPGHSHGQVVYDRVRNRVLLHYQFHPSSDPSFNSSMFQRVSQDCCGHIWGPIREITGTVNPRCNPHAPQFMQVGSAGSKVQTSSGRIIFLGHANGKEERAACRWWTDDGGETYDSTGPYLGNEASVAEVFADGGDRAVYMDARGLAYAWAGNRTSSWSANDGSTFTPPAASPVREDATFGCSAGLLSSADGKLLFLSEPAGPGRIGLTVHCSRDGGHTWPFSQVVGGAQNAAAYSAMRLVKDADGQQDRILIVWEPKPYGNMHAATIDYDFCAI